MVRTRGVFRATARGKGKPLGKVMKSRVVRLGLIAALLAPLVSLAAPSVYPTGVTIYNPSLAYNSYVIYAAPNSLSYLIDMDGNVVHRWPHAGFPTLYIDPALAGGEKGHVLVHLGKTWTNDPVIAELNWKGDVVWQWGARYPGGARQVQDWQRLGNGDTLILRTYVHVIPRFGRKPIADQEIVEVTPKGRVVWKWVAADHLNEFGISAAGMRMLHRALAGGFSGLGFLTINAMQTLGPNKWAAAGEKRFAPDNIIISSREASFVAIIDRRTGRVVWRIGPSFGTARKKPHSGGFGAASHFIEPTFGIRVPRPIEQLSGQHDAHFIPEGLPGAGNILLFDNEGPSGYPTIRLSHHMGSRVLEIDPVTREIVWQYTAENSGDARWTFYSAFLGSAYRLPNGNTLINEGMDGRLFQVTRQGKIVWEYVNPYKGPAVSSSMPGIESNWVYRARPVPYRWAPAGTPHAQIAVTPPTPGKFHVVR